MKPEYNVQTVSINHHRHRSLTKWSAVMQIYALSS